MASQSHQHQNQSSQSSSSSTESAHSSSGSSNAVNAEKARTGEDPADGLANYQATLGQWLGTELYQAIAPELTLDRMASHANKGLESAIKAALGALENATEGNTKAAMEQLSAGLKQDFGTIAGEWVKENGSGLSERLGDWVDANPILVVTAALLAAAGAVVANTPLPELKKKFKLGDNLTGSLAADLGKIRDISLKSISAQLSWTTGPLIAAVKATHSNGDTKTTLNASTGSETRSLTAEGQFVNEDLQLLNLEGVIKTGNTTLKGGAKHQAGENTDQTTLQANVTTEDGDTTRMNGVTYDPGTGTVTIERALTAKEDGITTKWSQNSGSDGSNETSLNVAGAVSENTKINLTLEESAQLLGAGTSYGLSRTQRANIGLDYSTTDLDAAMKLGLNSEGSGSLVGDLDYRLGNGWTTGADTKLNWGNKDYLEAGAYFGFRDPEQFQTYMTRYRFKDGDETVHQLDIMIEEKFGPLYTRLQQQVAHTSQGMTYETTAQGAYFINEKFAVIGGAQYRQNDMGESSLSPQLGAQIYGVPLIVTHNPETNSTTIGVTFKFGR
jgi:hypothetical protein